MTEIDKTEESDPIILAMEEAEAAEEAETTAGEDKPKEAETTAGEDKPKEAETTAGEDKPKEVETIMVPKGRLDQVLSDNRRLKDNLTYTQGIVDTQGKMLKKGDTTEEQTKTSQPVVKRDEIIANAEKAKLEASEKYEAGDMSLPDLEKQKITSDRVIREQEQLRTQEMVQGSTKAVNETISQNNTENERAKTAGEIAEKFPFVAVIDNLNPAMKNAVWGEIREDATKSLNEKGIDINDDRAFMTEMATLAELYSKKYNLGVKEGSGKNSHELSDKAKERSAKLDLSKRQPPEVSGTQGDMSAELTAKDVVNMSQDELADALEKNPDRVEKAAGRD